MAQALRKRKMPLLIAIGLVLVAMAVAVGSVRFLESAGRWHALEQRGVSAQATVLMSTYDPGGGDPNGWTSEEVVFQPSNANSEYARLGHHGPNTGQGRGSEVSVVYDPRHPSNVALLSELSAHRGDYTASRFVGAGGFVLAALLVLLAALPARRWWLRSGTPFKSPR
jgi:hypothetical protein